MIMLSKEKKVPYLLLTPGPLSTSDTVRSAMWYDSCTWDQDYKSMVTSIRNKLLQVAGCDAATYTTVLMQGSGTFGVESVLGSSIDRKKHQVLILQNGVYGKRMGEMAKILELPHLTYEVAEDKSYDVDALEALLKQHPSITHIAMVHCETTTGLLNDLEPVAKLAKNCNKYFIVDAMSSFGGIPIDMAALNIDFLVSSANKCIQGVPGFSFIICKKDVLQKLCKDNAKSLSLDLYDQWHEMEANAGKWRYTSPTHAVLAFHQALLELDAEGGVAARTKRYHQNQALLAEGMKALQFESYVSKALQSPIITTYLEPATIPGTDKDFKFADFYQHLKARGFVIYPGKVTNRNSFRIGTIGHLFPEDIKRFLQQVESFVRA
ncbi:MAG: 2-aminoethylphosphonate--pyruvate transaminase [Gammaproteobacteria bacterium RIFCSPHIGHO2_12_FULL_43_28]|nr:MAG: 2-aminoethylphosphonate--pyruvate transaminase [Gammaproteobacteria bacterium RIFCSPHIGHO2_12_FULL_43_28]